MADKNKIKIFIGGKIYTIIGNESEEHMQKVARYIDEKMTEISSAQRNIVLSPIEISVLTSINVADDYFKIKESMQNTIEEKENELYEQVQETLTAYKDKINELLTEKVKNEQEYNQIYGENLSYKKEIDSLKEEKEEYEQLQKKAISYENKIEVLIKEKKQLEENYRELKEKFRNYEDEIAILQQENENLAEKNLKLKSECDNARKELEEYIETFDK